MNYKMIFIGLLFVFALGFVSAGSHLVSADDDFDKKYEHHEGHDKDEKDYEDIGKTVGWGTAAAIGAAGLIFPIRRSTKFMVKNFPDRKKLFISLSKFFGKYHLFIGVIALGLSITHGVVMYLDKGELEGEGMIGLAAVILMAIAGIVGAVLFKNKKAKTLRTAHTGVIALAILIGLIHIFAS